MNQKKQKIIYFKMKMSCSNAPWFIIFILLCLAYDNVYIQYSKRPISHTQSVSIKIVQFHIFIYGHLSTNILLITILVCTVWYTQTLYNRQYPWGTSRSTSNIQFKNSKLLWITIVIKWNFFSSSYTDDMATNKSTVSVLTKISF